MATTVTASNLSVKLDDSLTLNNKRYGGSTTNTIRSCNEVDQRIMSIALKSAEGAPTWTDIFKFNTVNSRGQAIKTDFKYFRITNLDDTNYVILQFIASVANAGLTIKLGPNETFMLQDLNINVSCADPEAYPTYVDITEVRGAADTALVDIDYVTAYTRS